MQYREELFSKNPSCAPYQSPASISSRLPPNPDIIHVLFQIEFHIHKAVTTKTRGGSTVSSKIDNHCKNVCFEKCVFRTKISKTVDASLQCSDRKNTSGVTFDWFVKQQP